MGKKIIMIIVVIVIAIAAVVMLKMEGVTTAAVVEDSTLNTDEVDSSYLITENIENFKFVSQSKDESNNRAIYLIAEYSGKGKTFHVVVAQSRQGESGKDELMGTVENIRSNGEDVKEVDFDGDILFKHKNTIAWSSDTAQISIRSNTDIISEKEIPELLGAYLKMYPSDLDQEE